jgi:hypothetical protein
MGMDNESGRRLITSTLRFHPHDRLFPDAEDLLATLGHDVPASTAVTNSARFPFISPAGRFTDPFAANEVAAKRQIVDGGYYENYGAQSARELVRGIGAVAGPALGDAGAVVPVVVLITNPVDAVDAADPRAANGTPTLQDTVVRCGWQPPDPGAVTPSPPEPADDPDDSPVGYLSQALAPMVGLVATRSAHGRAALHELRRGLCPADGEGPPRLFNLALPQPDADADQRAPMNWVLNREARIFMLEQAPEVPFNAEEQAGGLAALLDALSASGPARASAAHAP